MSPRQHFTTVEEYMNSLAPEIKKKLQELRQIIRHELPNAEEVISYNIPTFKQDGYIVYFAGFRKHISLYPITEGMEKELPEIGKYRAGKGTLQFKLEEPLPTPLIRQVVQLLLEQNLARRKK